MTTLELYRKHKKGEVSREKFLYEVRRDNNLPFITNLTSYDDAVKILKNKGIVTEVETKEAKADEAVKAEVKAKAPSTKKPSSLHIDYANPYEYRHGLQYELNELGEYTDEALEKAKDKVLKNLAKDANFYSSLLNQQQSSYEFKQTETDKPGMQAKADGHLKKEAKKDEKSNVQDSLGKKEAGKKKPKGVKVMPDKGVTGSEKTIKEGIDDKVEDMIKSGKIKPEEVKTAAEKAMKGDSTSLIALMTGIKLSEDNIKENIEISKDQDEIEISADSGNYSGMIEDDGTISFSVFFDDTSDIEDEFGPEGITSENWKDVLGPDHAFVKIIKDIGGDVEAMDDYVQITVNADKLLDKYNINEGLAKGNKYIDVDDEGDYQLNPTAVATYLKSVIDSGYIEAVESFMTDDEGYDESSSYFFDVDDDVYKMPTEQEVEDWAKQEMSYYLFSKPDEFPSKGNMEEGSFMGGVDLGSSFEKMKGGMSAEDEFESLMKNYDWYAEFSDDPSKWKAQQSMAYDLKQLAKTIGVDRAVEIFNSYAPSDRKVTSSDIMWGMKEDKHTKLKEALKSALKKEIINPKDIQAAKSTGDVVNIPVQDTAAQIAAKNAKINFRTYKA